MANKIFLIVGPHEGVGKTTLAVNLAARLAQLRKIPLLLVDTDMVARGETAQVAGTASGGSVNHIVDQLATKAVSPAMLRSRIPLNRLGVGSVMIAPGTRAGEGLSSDQWSFFLQNITQA